MTRLHKQIWQKCSCVYQPIKVYSCTWTSNYLDYKLAGVPVCISTERLDRKKQTQIKEQLWRGKVHDRKLLMKMITCHKNLIACQQVESTLNGVLRNNLDEITHWFWVQNPIPGPFFVSVLFSVYLQFFWMVALVLELKFK